MILLVAGAIVSALLIPVGIAEVMLPEFTDDQEIGDNLAGFLSLMAMFGLGLLNMSIYIATVIVFSMWLYRCGRNLRAFGYWASQIEHSPGWAVGSFFVPIVNLWIPYRAVKEVWQKSERSDSVSFSLSQSRPWFFPAWWTFWLLSTFADRAYFRMSWRGADREATAMVGLLADVLSIAAAVFVIMVVKEIDRRQEEASRHLTTSGPPPPPEFHLQGGSAGADFRDATTPSTGQTT